MKSKILLIAVLIIFSQGLVACNNEYSQYEKMYEEEARKVIKDLGFTGRADMKLETESDIGHLTLKIKDIFSVVEWDYDIYTLLYDLYSINVSTGEHKFYINVVAYSGDDKFTFDPDTETVVINDDVRYLIHPRGWNESKESDSLPTFYYSEPETSPSNSSSNNSTCDTLFDNYDYAKLLSGGEITDLTTYYMNALMENDCFDIDD